MPKVVKRTVKKAPRRAELELAWPTDGIKINLYGRSGTGKTTLWATFPKPILALVCSGGKHPGELRSVNTPAYRKVITPLAITKSTDIHDLLEQDRPSEFATVVLEHASGLQDLVLKEILNLDELPAQSSWGLATQGDWGQCALQMKEILRALLSLPNHIVIVAQERDFNSDTTNDVLMPYVASALSPSVVGWLNPACDYICQTFIRKRMETKTVKIGAKTKQVTRPGKGVEYCLRTAPDDVYTTKFRIPRGGIVLPEVIVDPTFEKINRLINQG